MSIRTDIIDILKSRTCAAINFSIGGIRIHGGDYSIIANYVQNKTIQVIRANVNLLGMSIYNQMYNCFIINGTPIPNNIVHEGTHAINDWHHWVASVFDDEITAHVAQMIYLISTNRRVLAAFMRPGTRLESTNSLNTCRSIIPTCTPRAISRAVPIASSAVQTGNVDKNVLDAIAFLEGCAKNKCDTAITLRAGFIAIDLLSGRAINPNDLKEMRDALKLSPFYRRNVVDSRSKPKRARMDGVRHVNIPASFLQKYQGSIILN